MRVHRRGREVLIRSWLAAAAVTASLDLLWLGVLMKGTYRRALGHLMADSPSWTPAILFYALYGAGVVYFASSADAKTALTRGALLGLLVYGTYDLTNMAVLRNWGAGISALDVAWGVFLTSLAALAAGKAA